MCQKTLNAVSNGMTVCHSQAIVEWCTKYGEGRLVLLLALHNRNGPNRINYYESLMLIKSSFF